MGRGYEGGGLGSVGGRRAQEVTKLKRHGKKDRKHNSVTESVSNLSNFLSRNFYKFQLIAIFTVKKDDFFFLQESAFFFLVKS